MTHEANSEGETEGDIAAKHTTGKDCQFIEEMSSDSWHSWSKAQKVAVATGAYPLIDENGDIHYMPDPSNLGTVGDKGPEGEQGPPGHSPLYELGYNEPCWISNEPALTADLFQYEGTPMYGREETVEESTSPKIQLPNLPQLPPGISLQDIISSKKVAATETGAVVLMPQEFDADNVKAYIQQEIEAGILSGRLAFLKEHQTELMRKVADVLAEEITKVKNTQKTREAQQEYRIASLDHSLKAHIQEAAEFDKQRALDIAELQLKVEELEARLEAKTQETKLLRSKLHAVSISKPVRKVKRRKYDEQRQDTSKPGAGGSKGG